MSMTKDFTEEKKNLVNQFNQSIRTDKDAIRFRNCLCGSNLVSRVAKYDRYGFWHPTVICKNCGLIYNNPHMDEKVYIKFYESDFYRKIYTNQDPLKYADDLLGSEYGKYIYDDCLPLINKNSSVMEFGCGGGWNLIHFQKNGHNCVGYDYSPSLTDFGKKKYNLDLKQGNINSITGSYDLIILNHVIEHFIDLEENIKKIVSYLKPDGYVYIGVPNIDNYSIFQLQNAHLFYFSPRTFTYYMNKFGLELIKQGPAQQTHMYGIFKIKKTNELDNLSLKDEYFKMRIKITKSHLKYGLTLFLEKMGVKNILKSILQFFS